MSTSREYEVVSTPEAEGGFNVGPSPPSQAARARARPARRRNLMIRKAIEIYIASLVAHGDSIRGLVEIERFTVAA